jgi:hypothetical protein
MELVLDTKAKGETKEENAVAGCRQRKGSRDDGSCSRTVRRGLAGAVHRRIRLDGESPHAVVLAAVPAAARTALGRVRLGIEVGVEVTVTVDLGVIVGVVSDA